MKIYMVEISIIQLRERDWALEGRGRGSVVSSNVQQRVQTTWSDHIIRVVDLRSIILYGI